jgi:group I intron endonuclease
LFVELQTRENATILVRIEITLERFMDYTGKAVIYKIINIENAKFYIGSSIVVAARWRKHVRELRAGRHHCPHLQAAWNKYGEDSFVFRVVEVVDPASGLPAAEQRWLDEHHGKEHCYNFAKYVDNSNRGTVRADAHKAALSRALTEFYKNNPHPATGRVHSTGSRELMSKNRAGKAVSGATRELLRQANLGRTASAETRAKLSAQRKGRVRSEAHAAKYNKPIVEVTTGQVYESLKAVKEMFGMSPGMLAKALAADKPLAKGKNKGKHFKYVDPTDLQ